MPKPIDASKRFTGRECLVCKTCERFVKTHACCECNKRNGLARYRMPKRYRPVEEKPRSAIDPTRGAAFPAGLARCMAAR